MVKLRDNSPVAEKTGKPERFPSLDALRGLLLLLMVANGFGLAQLLPSERWNWITKQWVHRDWLGCSLWDLLPAGMLFVAGASMPFSYANRQAKGQGWPRQAMHALIRTGLLLVLGVYLDSYRANHLVLDLRGDLQQFALAYLLAFLVLPLGMPVQGVTLGFLLIGHTTALVIYAFLGGHELWSQAQNLGLALDRGMYFDPHPERYVTFNLIPATAIILTGVLTGGLVRSSLTPGHKVVIMTVASFSSILLGWLLSGGDGWIDLSWTAVIPMIKRLGTLTYVLTSVGWTMLLFTYFYTVMEGFLWRGWAFPLTVLGQNPLILYLAYQLFRPWAVRSALLVLPESRPFIASFRPLLVELIVVAIFWIFCFWLDRRRVYFKV